MKKAFSCQLVMLQLHRPQNTAFAKLLLELSRNTLDSGALTCRSLLLLMFATVNSVSDLKRSERFNGTELHPVSLLLLFNTSVSEDPDKSTDTCGHKSELMKKNKEKHLNI